MCIDVHIEPYVTRGMYQPSAGVSFILSGADHIMFVNQGAWKSYTTPDFPYNWTEIQRGTDFVSGKINSISSVSPSKYHTRNVCICITLFDIFTDISLMSF